MDLDESTRNDPVELHVEGCLIRQLPERPLVATCLRCKAITSASFLPANGPVGMIANDLRMWSNMMRDACMGAILAPRAQRANTRTTPASFPCDGNYTTRERHRPA